MRIAAAFAPAATGLKMIKSVQLRPTGSEEPHALRSVKSSACEPTTAMDEIATAAVPVLVKLTARVAEAVPTD